MAGNKQQFKYLLNNSKNMIYVPVLLSWKQIENINIESKVDIIIYMLKLFNIYLPFAKIHYTADQIFRNVKILTQIFKISFKAVYQTW